MIKMDSYTAFSLMVCIIASIGIACTYWSDYRHRRQQHRHS